MTQVVQVFFLQFTNGQTSRELLLSLVRLLIFAIKEKFVRFITSPDPIVVFKFDVVTFSEIVKDVMKYWNLDLWIYCLKSVV